MQLFTISKNSTVTASCMHRCSVGTPRTVCVVIGASAAAHSRGWNGLLFAKVWITKQEEPMETGLLAIC